MHIFFDLCGISRQRHDARDNRFVTLTSRQLLSLEAVLSVSSMNGDVFFFFPFFLMKLEGTDV